MKLLIIHAQGSVKTKWVEPLRKEGWGVLCVASTQEAEQVLQFHGRSLDGLVLHREQAGVAAPQAMEWFNWFKTQNEYSSVPTMIVSTEWSERDYIKHQNSDYSANAYLHSDASIEQFKRKVEGLHAKEPELPVSLRKVVGQEIALEDVSEVLSKPEHTRSYSHSKATSISLAAPNIFLGGGKTSTNTLNEPIKPVPAPASHHANATSISLEAPTQLKIATAAPAQAAPEENKTLIIESTQIDGFESFNSVGEEVTFEGEIEEYVPEVVEETYTPPPVMEFRPAQPLPVSGVASDDMSTLKNYLSMREQDVAVLTGQVRSAQERIHHLEVQLKIERARSMELQHTVNRQDQTLKSYDQDKQVDLDVLYKQVEDLNLQLKERTDRTRLIESKLKVMTEEVGKIKERVRVDIRRIRVREKELESQLEILKKDSSALLMARDEKIIELKRKLDLMEFNMELVQEQYGKERSATEQLRQRLKDASSAMKQAGGLLDHEN